MTYKIDKTFALSGAQGDARKAKNDVIILHDVGNIGSTGRNNANYTKNGKTYDSNGNPIPAWQNAYVHFFIDGDIVYQVGTPGYVAWGAMDWANLHAPVQIEIDNQTDSAKFKKSYATFIALARDMAKKYDIDLDLDLKNDYGIKTHKWVSDNKAGDHQDPYAYLAKMGISKAQLAKDLKNGIEVEKMDTYWNRSDNHFNLYEATTTLNVYSDAKLKNKRRVTYNKGSRFYAQKVIKDGKTVTRLQLANGFVSGNTKFSKRIKY